MSALLQFNRAISYLYKIIRPISIVCTYIGMFVLSAMMFLTAVDVLLRKLINMPILGSFELTQYMLAITISMGLAYCTLKKGHVVIELVISRFSPRTKAIANSITGLLGVILILLMTWQAYVYTIVLAKTKTISPILAIPVFPIMGIITFGIASISLVFFIHFLEYLEKSMKK